jgi:hypothetical protein
MFSQLSSKIRDGRKGILGFTVFIFLMAAAMEFSDGILTPAISVISAVEGIKTINPELEFLVVPITVVILAALFIFQFKGTHRLGKVFGPVMVVWFLTISVIGISQIAQNPASLVAINPMYAANFVIDHGFQTLFVMRGDDHKFSQRGGRHLLTACLPAVEGFHFPQLRCGLSDTCSARAQRFELRMCQVFHQVLQ